MFKSLIAMFLLIGLSACSTAHISKVPYDNNGNVLTYHPYGLDREGLATLKDGTFWVSDEYAPHIVHYSATGVELERKSPLGVKTSGRKLPAVLERRWPNRGMEGLAITPDKKALVANLVTMLSNHYPHDKPEGFWIIDSHTVTVLNDDGFAVWPKDDEVVQKILPGANQTDANTLYVLKLKKALY